MKKEQLKTIAKIAKKFKEIRKSGTEDVKQALTQAVAEVKNTES